MENAMKLFHDMRSDSAPPTILDIAEKYGVPYTTLWKRVKGIVEGTGHHSGGKNNPHVFPQ